VCECECVFGTVWSVFVGVSVKQVAFLCVCECECVCMCVCVEKFGACFGSEYAAGFFVICVCECV